MSDAPAPRSFVTVVNADGTSPHVIFTSPELFEAPNWSPDGKHLVLNSRGRLWRLPVEGGGEPEEIEIAPVTGINNDHGFGPGGREIAISAGHIYVVAASGGKPRQVTEQSPSYWHGWSPDGRTLAYCAPRNNVFNLYAISPDGGTETRLTGGGGYDDGPDYSPDGRWIFFNSNRTGHWRIWRIPAAGGGEGDRDAVPLTDDECEDWFPHPSPDGKWLVFLSFPKDTQGHPPNQNVTLRRLALNANGDAAGKPETIVPLFGGQGTINVPSWSPDSRRFAYVRYAEPNSGGTTE